MNEHFRSTILQATGAKSFIQTQSIQDLWSGYGKIMRIHLAKSPFKSVVVKHVKIPISTKHPLGKNTNIGHLRKLKSYQIETHWYKNYSQFSSARLPHCLAIDKQADELLIVLEDLDQAGYYLRKLKLNWDEITTCLQWLAKFHSTYLNKEPKGLWKIGSYWHLDTRPEELEAMEDVILKEAAALIDKKLNSCKFKTFIHGDAKLANFCFSQDGKVAGVDFQYVGGGCGIKDVVYFVGSCLNENDCERLESKILDTYFKFLQNEFKEKNESLESEWRSLYPVAWADFHRFLKGWNPRHWKINSYSERITTDVINNL